MNHRNKSIWVSALAVSAFLWIGASLLSIDLTTPSIVARATIRELATATEQHKTTTEIEQIAADGLDADSRLNAWLRQKKLIAAGLTLSSTAIAVLVAIHFARKEPNQQPQT